MTLDDLLKMKLHDKEEIRHNEIVMRVVGGWLYFIGDSVTLVPELKKVKDPAWRKYPR